MLIQDIVEFPKQFVKHAEEESIHAKDSTYFGPLVSFSMFVAKKVTDDINDTVKYCSNGSESVSDDKLATTTCSIKQEETAMENEGGGWMSDLNGFVEYIQGIAKAENVQQESTTEQGSSEQSTQQPIQQSGSIESAFWCLHSQNQSKNCLFLTSYCLSVWSYVYAYQYNWESKYET